MSVQKQKRPHHLHRPRTGERPEGLAVSIFCGALAAPLLTVQEVRLGGKPLLRLVDSTKARKITGLG